MSDTTIKNWVRKYKTEDMKIHAIKEVVENKKSLYEVAEVYSISSRSILNN